MTMHEGEVASFTIPPQHAFGAAGSSNQYELALVPPNSVVIYELELLSVVDVV
jgi:FK506-binding protein 4/5